MENQILPLGGIGAGYLLLDREGHLSCHIPATPFQGRRLEHGAAFLRIVTASGLCYLRRLCGSVSGEEVDDGVGAPPYLPPSGFQCQFHYPNASFQLVDPEAPADVTWTYFNPIIPYDHVAAVMPVVIMGIRVQNPSPEPCDVSVMLLFDNICHFQDADTAPEEKAIHPVRVSPNAEGEGNFLRGESRGDVKKSVSGPLCGYEANALVFGERRNTPVRTRLPHACLAARKRPGAEYRVAAFNPENPEESAQFWNTFRKEGEVSGFPEEFSTQLGAVCVTTTVPPGASHRFDFAFAWHVPDEADKTGRFGSAYVRSFKSAQETVYYALRHIDYMVVAVEKWQRRLLSPKLPADFGRAVVDAGAVFTTHTRHTPSGAVVFVRDTEPPGNMKVLPWDFFSAMALLVFAPHFHTLSVTHALNTALVLRKDKDFSETPDTMCEAAMLTLSAYADVIFLGHRARMAEWLPQLDSLFCAVSDCDVGDGASMQAALSRFSLKGLGLWAAALEAMAHMALESGEKDVARNARQACSVLYARYETRLLDLGKAAEGQEDVPGLMIALKDLPALAGPCFSRLLGMEPSTKIQGLVTLLTAELDMTCGTNSHIPLFDYAVRVLARLLYKGRGGGSVPEMKSLFSSLSGGDGIPASEARSPRNLPGPETLARWVVLQAASGFSYDALRQRVALRLPQDFVRILKFPILSPLSLGIMIIKRVPEEDGLILLRFCVETPLTIGSILLHLSKPTILESVSCIRNDETITVRHEAAAENNNTLIRLVFKTVQKMVNTFTMRLRELEDREV
ncbi:MAG TPA: GH116 family glycosyl-hydrolase [Candidatus Hydrogenedentes bacterium]|nr:GH116 family glycosyl-hydrolase [Candidatus Hydrogenedentota bacterium]